MFLQERSKMNNIPDIKIGIVAGSRDWLPVELAVEARKKLVGYYNAEFTDENVELYECPVCITDNEIGNRRVLKDLGKAECNALCVYFANYGPEVTSAMIAAEFDGPVVFVAAAEEGEEPYHRDRKDSFCGLIDSCYALGLRKEKVYIPGKPVGTIEECANMIHEFIPVARSVIALKNLKIIAVGPQPATFIGAFASRSQLYDLGVEFSEYSEMELFESFTKHQNDNRIADKVSEMEKQLGEAGNTFPDRLSDFAKYELTVEDWIRSHKGNKKYVVFTGTCWPLFPSKYGFAPCYVHSRLTEKGIPVSCEVDVYGALSEYIGQCISNDVVSLLDINNNVPESVFNEKINGNTYNNKKYSIDDLFIGYHCGVTCMGKVCNGKLGYHFVNRQLIGDSQSQGTVQGQIVSGPVTIFRIQATIDGKLEAYVIQGQVLPVSIDTYGGYGVIGIPEMRRFYRNVIIDRHFPNHAAIIFGHFGKELVALLRYFGISDIYYNHPSNIPYEGETAFDYLDDWY